MIERMGASNFALRQLARAVCLLTGMGVADATMAAQPVSSGTAERTLLVMLQGPDLAAIERAATNAGAGITHRLPIINGIGARMSPEQLRAIRAKVPSITRVIDDLDWEPDDELLKGNPCRLGGALELAWTGATARWRLFNKGDEPLTLDAGSIRWPEALGELKAVRLEQQSVDLDTLLQDERHASWQGATLTLAPNRSASMQWVFGNAPVSVTEVQNALEITVSSTPDCKTELAPSYAEPALDTYFPSVTQAAVLHAYGVTGKGITVAVLDSGLWEGHPEIAHNTLDEPRVLARFDAINNREVDALIDESGHGTHMTSVIARSGRVTREGARQPSYRGIAPDAQIVAVKAIGKSGEAGFLDMVRAIQWVVDNRERYGIRVLNLSLASRPRWPYYDDPVNQALMRAWQAGIFITAAAGNEGPEPMSVGSPGNLPYLLTVGAMTDSWTERDTQDDYIPDFSSRGPTPMGHIKPDLVAPGGHIAGIISPGSMLERTLPEYILQSGEFVMTGTSQATAVVSGLAALLLQLEPGISNDALKCALKTSAQPAIEADGTLAYSPFIQGDGLISVTRALTVGDRVCEQNQLNLQADISGADHFSGPAVFAKDADPTLPDADKVISQRESEKGFSPTRRWGIEQHLQRLTTPPVNAPINWVDAYEKQQRKLIRHTNQP